jgi:uncharacterized membrane protein
MKDVEEVRQIDDTPPALARQTSPAGRSSGIRRSRRRSPIRRISWRSTSGPPNSGAVTFDRVHDNRTRITLRMSYRAPGWPRRSATRSARCA